MSVGKQLNTLRSAEFASHPRNPRHVLIFLTGAKTLGRWSAAGLGELFEAGQLVEAAAVHDGLHFFL